MSQQISQQVPSQVYLHVHHSKYSSKNTSPNCQSGNHLSGEQCSRMNLKTHRTCEED